MIFNRLYELAVREKLLDDPAFEVLPVPYLILVGDGGEYLGFSDIRGETTIPAKKKGGADKKVRDKGRLLTVPRSHESSASQGTARFFVDTIPRVLPVALEDEGEQRTAHARRVTFWEQIDRAAGETNDPALRAVQSFGRRSDEFTGRIRADVAKEEPADGSRVTFAYRPSGGPTLLEEEKPKEWYRKFFAGVSTNKQEAGPVGVCQVTGNVGPIKTTHEFNFQGVPNGHQKGVKLISFNQAAFRHYGLEKAENAGLGYEATEGYQRALDALLRNALPTIKERGGKTKFVVGGTAFVYWTREPRDAGFMSLVDDPVSDPMKVLFESITSGKNAAHVVDAAPFYMLALSANDVRAVVRGYLETTLGEAKANAVKWFDDLRIADTSKDYSGAVNDKFSLKWLAGATVPLKENRPDWDKLQDRVSEALLTAAITGGLVPEAILIACLQRLKVEGSKAFRANRMALIKLTLTRLERSMSENPEESTTITEQLDSDERDPAYVYGRLLSVFEQIQYAALDAVNSNVVDKFYSTMSTSPGMIFGRLIENAQNHLKKLRTDGRAAKKNAAKRFDRYLTQVRTLLSAAPPKLQHSPQEQARFALGFYHEKAKRIERIEKAIAKRKQESKPE